jgi:hypothetical protein
MNVRETTPAPTEATAQDEQHEQQRFKTVPVRLEMGLHTQLRFISQLNASSIADEIRNAVEARILAAQNDPDLLARADQKREEIEREAAERSAAIASFLGKPAVAAAVTTTAKTTGRGQTSK